ncbi:MAG: hypothetical protein SPJ23_05420 [Eubacteriales bacterium]|nr:hypothetical protein [Eubacteriales bacterium]
MRHRAYRLLSIVGFLFFAWILVLTEPPQQLAALCAAVLLHEGGHLVALRFAGMPAKRLILLPVGLRLEREVALCGFGTEAVVYLAGPAVSLLSAAFALPHCNPEAGGMVFIFFLLSAGLGLFNLIPLPGTDGCGALRCLLFTVCHSEGTARRILSAVTMSLSVLFFGAAAAYWIRYETGFYPLCASVYFLLSGIAERCGGY